MVLALVVLLLPIVAARVGRGLQHDNE